MSDEKVNWSRAAPDPRALVFLPWGHKGITIAKRDADGTLYGCRDVALGLGFADIIAAWFADARDLTIEDKANARQTVVEYANQLLAKVSEKSTEPHMTSPHNVSEAKVEAAARVIDPWAFDPENASKMTAEAQNAARSLARAALTAK